MKHIVILGDGMGDRPIESLGGRTPLGAAEKPYMDKFAREGLCGTTTTLYSDFPMGSDVANLSVLGFPPKLFYTGRSPIEALGLELDFGPDDMIFRANLVNVEGNSSLGECVMIDHSSDKITDEEAAELVGSLNEILPPEIRLYAGASYRNILIWKDFLRFYDPSDISLAPPHDILGQKVSSYLPAGSGSEILLAISEKSRALLDMHPVNIARKAKGLRTANCLWMWGEGTKPCLSGFKEKYGLDAAMITAVPLLQGIAVGTGMKNIAVENVTGDINTNYEGKADAAVEALKAGADLVFVHIEAADECGHDGNTAEKIKSIEYIDSRVIGRILSRLGEINDEVKFLLMPDHATPICERTHTVDPIPFAIWSSARSFVPNAEAYDEASAAKTGFIMRESTDLMGYFINL